MGTLNDLINLVSICLAKGESLDNLCATYGSEMIADALQFIRHEQKEVIEIEEDYDNM